MHPHPLKNKKLLLPLLVVIFIILYHVTPLARIFDPIQRPIAAMGGIFFNAGDAARGFLEGLVAGKRMTGELQEQTFKLAASESEVARLRYLEQENQELRSLLGFVRQTEPNLLGARVLSRNAELGINTITLNRGADEGVSAGLPVVAGEGILIGKIHRVFPHTAVALLATDSGSTIAVSFARNTDIQAIATGNLGIGLRMELIPQDVEVGIGDLVVSSSLEARTPAGLLVGRIAQIEYREGELFQTAWLEPIIATVNLTTVGIILPPEE